MVPTYLFRKFVTKGNYWDEIVPNLYLGAFPFAPVGHVEKFIGMKITNVVNLMSEYRGPLKRYSQANIHQLWLPVVDHFEPTSATTAFD